MLLGPQTERGELPCQLQQQVEWGTNTQMRLLTTGTQTTEGHTEENDADTMKDSSIGQGSEWADVRN